MNKTSNNSARYVGLGAVLVAVFAVGHFYLGAPVVAPVPTTDVILPSVETTTPGEPGAVVPTTPAPTTPAPIVTTPKPTSPASTPAPKPTPQPTPPPVVQAPKSPFKDGTYTSTGNYNSPGGGESISVTITLKDGVITSSSVVGHAENPASKQYQGMFVGGYAAQVSGKSITDVKLSQVSGSSLTPRGWNDAVTKIQAQAKA